MSVPKVWSRFTAKKKDRTVLKLRIEELTEDRWNELLDFLRNNFIGSESFQRAAGIFKNEDAVQEYKEIYGALLKDPKLHVVICCDDSQTARSPIIGMSAMYLESKGDEDLMEKFAPLIQTPEMQKLFEILIFLENLFEEKKVLGLDTYYSGKGIVVDQEYRRLGIAHELVRLRTVISKEHGVQATGAWMTADGTQISAERYNWKTVYEISFEEVGKATGADFTGAPVMCKKMILLI